MAETLVKAPITADTMQGAHPFLETEKLADTPFLLPSPVMASRHPFPFDTPSSPSKLKHVSSINLGGTRIQLTSAVIIPFWIVLSSGVIIYNNYIFNNLNFRYPVFLVSWHLVFATIGTRILARTTRLLDATRDFKVSNDMYIRSILPIAVLFCGSLVLSNKAYLYLSVSFIQMLKAFTPVTILLISFSLRTQTPSRRLLLIVVSISLGVSMASYGELRFNAIGFGIQSLAIIFEASRLVMIEILLQGLKMDPLVSLHCYAPPCAVLTIILLLFSEGVTPFNIALTQVGFFHLMANAMLAFTLNVAAVWLVGVGGGLVLTLAGVFKDILLITGSVLIFGSLITSLQVVGYSIALIGLIVYKSITVKSK
ncbi:hypothetical protein FRC14_005307 [Serendipita sp. 396]|nr:hypothetical protein FRC14_005307 [Serendipita sp. 396]KAG8824596.1 hypothetical protein FRC19_001449 [Serendipita sp. 401]